MNLVSTDSQCNNKRAERVVICGRIMRKVCVWALACALMGCTARPRVSPVQNGPVSTIPRVEAVQLLQDYLKKNPDLGKWANGDPFYVGDWNGYVAKCKSEGLIHSGGVHGWDTSGITVVVFRRPFLPIGGGREDFFTIDKTKKIYHVRGLVGR